MKYGYLIPKAVFTFTEWLGRVTIFGLKKAKNVVYERKIRYSDKDNKLYLNICRPKEVQEDNKLPVFVYIHGGGWISGMPESRESLVSHLAAAGFFTINIRYGLAPKYGHPLAIRNIYDALAWLVENKDKYHLDLDRLYIGGESAGAHLSATIGAISANEEYKSRFGLNEISKDLTFKGLLLICGIYDMEEAIASGFPFFKTFLEAYYGKPAKYLKDEPEAIDLSPLHFINKDYPASFIVSAAHDQLKGGSNTLAVKLKELGVKQIHYRETGLLAVHAFLVAQILPQSKRTMPKVLDFLQNGTK